MRIDLVRHGMTPGNEQRRYVGGSTDEGLSAKGRSLLRAICADASVARVYSSTLKRTVQTAQILFPEAGIVPLRDLREMEFGSFEGKNADELAEDASYRAWVDDGCVDACPGGESRSGFAARCIRAFVDCVKREERFGVERTVLVVHGGTIMAILSELADPAIGYFEASIPPGGRWVCEWDGDRLTDVRCSVEGTAPCSR